MSANHIRLGASQTYIIIFFELDRVGIGNINIFFDFILN